MQGEFNELVIWTRNPNSEDIAIFNADRGGNTLKKKTQKKSLFIHLTNKTCDRH